MVETHIASVRSVPGALRSRPASIAISGALARSIFGRFSLSFRRGRLELRCERSESSGRGAILLRISGGSGAALQFFDERGLLPIEAMRCPQASFFARSKGAALSGLLPDVRCRGSKRDVVEDALDLEAIVLDDELEAMCLSELVELADVVVHCPMVQSPESHMCVSPREAMANEMRDALPLLLGQSSGCCRFMETKRLRCCRDPRLEEILCR